MLQPLSDLTVDALEVFCEPLGAPEAEKEPDGPPRYCALCGGRLAKLNKGLICLRHQGSSAAVPAKGKGKIFTGQPCPVCGGTERYTKTRRCVTCVRKRRSGGDQESVTYTGTPCRICGSTERYRSNGCCVRCLKAKSKRKDE